MFKVILTEGCKNIYLCDVAALQEIEDTWKVPRCQPRWTKVILFLPSFLLQKCIAQSSEHKISLNSIKIIVFCSTSILPYYFFSLFLRKKQV